MLLRLSFLIYRIGVIINNSRLTKKIKWDYAYQEAHTKADTIIINGSSEFNIFNRHGPQTI